MGIIICPIMSIAKYSDQQDHTESVIKKTRNRIENQNANDINGLINIGEPIEIVNEIDIVKAKINEPIIGVKILLHHKDFTFL